MSENVFQFPYVVLTCLGLWAIESKNRLSNILYFAYQVWVFFYLFMFTSFLLWDLYSVRKDVHKASTNLSATMTAVMLLWKNTQGLHKFQQLRRLQKYLSSGLHSFEDERDRQILRNAKKENRVTCLIVYMLGMGTMTGWLASGLTIQSRDTLPLPVSIPWAHEDSPYYELALAFQIYGGYFVTFDVLSLNLTIFGSIVQICAEFDILLKNTEIINQWCSKLPQWKKGVRALSKEENHEVERFIIRNIQHHQKIIYCANEAESCYVHMMLVQFAGSALLITVVFLDLILVTRELSSRVYPLIIFLLLVTSDIYLFCYYGARLINKSHEFLNHVYGLPWEVMNSSNRQIISIVILKAQRPPKLTVEKFANIDLYSLLRLIKIVYNILYLLLHLARDR